MLLTVLCLAVGLLNGAAPEPDPEPVGSNSDYEVKRLDALAAKEPAEKFAKTRDAIVKKLRAESERLLKAGKEAKAVECADRAALIASIEKEKRFEFDAKTKVADVLEKASVKGKYCQLLRVIHLPHDKASYTEFRDYGSYSGTSYAGYNDLPVGYWVYHYPHWYIWKGPKP
jgi:hypothetical protein